MLQLVIRNEILEDRHIPLAGPTVLVGRDAQAHVRFQENGVSRFHARFEISGGAEATLVDLGSSNGTFVNEERLTGPRAVKPGDEIRFGPVRAAIAAAATPASVSAAPLSTAAAAAGIPGAPLAPAAAVSRAPGLPRPAALVAGVTVVAVVAALVLLASGDSDDPPRTPSGSSAAGDATTMVSTPAPDGTPPEPPSPAPVPADPEPPPDPGPEPPPEAPPGETPPAEPARPLAAEPPASISMADGSAVRAWIVDQKDAAFLLVREEGRDVTRRIPREDIVAIDGKPAPPDLERIFEARLAGARDLPRLGELLAWCGRKGLTDAAAKTAQAIVAADPGHDAANAVLGRFRLRGAWKTRDELAAAGALGRDGRPAGSDRDLLEIRRLHFDLLGRPPAAEEAAEGLRLTRAALVDRLLQDPARWKAWIEEAAALLLGSEGAGISKRHQKLADDLAHGASDFREAFRALALSDALRARAPDPRELARRALQALLGPAAAADASLVENAGRMAAGERVAIFGERGASREEMVEICLRQPGFYRRQVEVEGRRCLGRSLTRDEASKATFRLAAAPGALREMQKEWLLSEESVKALETPRRKDDDRYLAGLLLDGFGRVPAPEEVARLRAFVAALDGSEPLRGVVAGLVGRSPSLAAPPKAADAAAFVEDSFRRILARAPAPAELDAFTRALAAGSLPRHVVAALLASPEYDLY